MSQQFTLFSLHRALKERILGMLHLSEVLMRIEWSLREEAEMLSQTDNCPNPDHFCPHEYNRVEL